MKKLILLLVLMSSINFVAQEKLNQGMIVMKQTISSDNEEVNAQLAMMGDMEIKTYFKNGKSRTEQSNPMSGDVVSIIDLNSKKILTMMSNPMMGNKYMTSEMTVDGQDSENLKIEKGKLTKTIMGYECQQYFVNFSKDGQNIKMEMYTTEKIEVPSQTTASFGNKMKGFPMYLKMDMQQMGATMSVESKVTEIKKQEIDDSKFDMTIPAGYEKMEE